MEKVKEVYPSHAFGPRPVEHIDTKFDTDYESIEIVDKVVKTGEGENDFVIQKCVLRSKTPIQEVVDADKDSVGVYNIIKQVLRTGDTSLLPADRGDSDNDFVNAPTDLMQLKEMGVNAEKHFGELPPELVNGMDMKAFVNSMDQEKFDAFVKAIADRSSGKEKEINE